MCESQKASRHLESNVPVDRADLLHAEDPVEMVHCKSKLPVSVTVHICANCADFVEHLYPEVSMEEIVDGVETSRRVSLDESIDTIERRCGELARAAGQQNEVHKVVEFGPYKTSEGWLIGSYSVSGWNFTWGEDHEGPTTESTAPRKTREQARKGAELIRAALIAGDI